MGYKNVRAAPRYEGARHPGSLPGTPGITHPDKSLMQVCDRYVNLLCGLMKGPDEEGVKALLSEIGKGLSS